MTSHNSLSPGSNQSSRANSYFLTHESQRGSEGIFQHLVQDLNFFRILLSLGKTERQTITWQPQLVSSFMKLHEAKAGTASISL